MIGKEDKIPVRLIIDIVPEEVYQKRLKKIEQYNRKKGNQTTDDYKTRARFNLMITNIYAKLILVLINNQVSMSLRDSGSTFHYAHNDKMFKISLLTIVRERSSRENGNLLIYKSKTLTTLNKVLKNLKHCTLACNLHIVINFLVFNSQNKI